MVEEVLLNLLAQGLWEYMISPLVGLGADVLARNRAEPALSAIEGVASTAASELSEISALTEGMATVEATLARAEVRELIRELYVFNAGSQPDGVGKARSAFAAFWKAAAPSVAAEADVVFDVILTAADATLADAIKSGSLLALDTRSSLRERIVLDHIQALERRLASAAGQPVDIKALDRFELRLRKEMGERNGTITPPDFHSAPRVQIDELYVVPTLELINEEPATRTNLEYREWMGVIDRCVVLGNPGAGKSTLAKKVCHDLASGVSELSGRNITPFIVTLKDYGADKRANGYSVREFIETQVHSSLQIEIPQGGIEYLLSIGRLLVIFDGLDELLDTSYRQEIRSDVESFGRQYPATPLIVTSREVGYSQAPLEPAIFSMIRIAEFDDGRVEEYASKWFALDKEMSPAEQEKKASAFVAESFVVRDLRSNPLLLALMCNLYRGQNYIPRNRPDVYESCARMLFEVWDKSRGIESVLPIAEHLRPAMQFLASWIYSDESLREGVTREQLIEKSTEFLLRWRFEDPHRARHAATEFVDFCRGRAWVFSDLGSTEGGSDLFQFTHRTFLEYFAAAYLVESNPSNEALIRVLEPHVAQQEWDVVAQVAFQLRSRNQLGAADELTELILAKAAETELAERVNYTSFLGRALSFLVPTPQSVRRVVEAVVDCAVEMLDIADGRDVRWGVRGGVAPGQVLSAVTTVDSEIAENVRQYFVERLDELLATRDVRSSAAARIVAGLNEQASQLDQAWRSDVEELAHSRRERIVSLGAEDGHLAAELVTIGWLPFEDALEAVGAEWSFEMRPSMQGGGWYSPVAVVAAGTVMGGAPASSGDPFIAEQRAWLRALAQYGLSAEPPWVELAAQAFVPAAWGVTGRDGREGQESFLDLNELERFGLFLVTATWVELGNRIANRDRRNAVEGFGLNGPKMMREVGDVVRLALREDLRDEGPFQDPEMSGVMRRWARSELNLVSMSP